MQRGSAVQLIGTSGAVGVVIWSDGEWARVRWPLGDGWRFERVRVERLALVRGGDGEAGDG